MSDLIPPNKQCKDCGEVKPAAEFWRRKQSPDGLALYCKECFGLRNAAAYRKRQAAEGKSARDYRRHSAVPDGMKYCAVCKKIKPVSEFGRNRAEPSGLASYCRRCHNKTMAEIKAKKHGSTRSYHLQRRYGMTEREVEELAQRHGDVCLICLRRRALHVDHDHATGEVRGMLCFTCNGALGQFKDDALVMRRAVDYLEGRLVEPVQPRRAARRSKGAAKSRRHYRLMQKYGIGADEVERLVERQGGVCPICRAAEPAHVDHDHVTGAVRGILCGDCNTGMGQLRDDPWLVRRAIEYLTGGLSGIRLTEDGGFEVAVVRPRPSGEVVVDPGWLLGRACTDDLALLHAMAEGNSEDPWETDVFVVGPEPSEERFPGLDLSDPGSPDRGALPRAPLGPPEWALTAAD
ncbi:endonuclease VII domain-containing protein [Actinoallomurus rhizosphaericola]|uniref:endonuclease VII domain-containing protein n=1 Tax=Actinoallomurus rhizosphaericola TaxID=2952536 RepID=UPI0020934401|nr:endonuclease VII domain-containing protein [Actinoallomurus rhizosphaericola]MCO5997109.1 endonuclease VII domain-containing protein [Actinoallomurus rhizosphaericola]